MESPLDPKIILARVNATIAEMEARPPQLRSRCASLLAALYEQRAQLAAAKRSHQTTY